MYLRDLMESSGRARAASPARNALCHWRSLAIGPFGEVSSFSEHDWKNATERRQSATVLIMANASVSRKFSWIFHPIGTLLLPGE